MDPYMGDDHEDSASEIDTEHEGLDEDDEGDARKRTDESEDAPPYLGDMYE